MSNPFFKCEKTGFWKTKTRPANTRLATTDDIWTTTGQPKGVKVLVKSYHEPLYHVSFISKPIHDHELIQFIKDKRVFIKTE